MKWYKIIREDGRIEYNCEHGVGHGEHVHGCDGCCAREDYPLRIPSITFSAYCVNCYPDKTKKAIAIWGGFSLCEECLIRMKEGLE